MTKPIDIKRLEKEIENLMNNFGIKREYRNAFGWQLKDLIKQLVESVPVEERDESVYGESAMISPRMYGGLIAKSCDKIKQNEGYNQHVQEIKQWKEEILKQLE